MAEISGFSWGATVTTLGDPGGVVTWSIAPGGLDIGIFPSGPGTSVHPASFLTINYQQLIGQAFDEWSTHGNIEFMQIADGGGDAGVGTQADIRIFFGDISGGALGYAFFPTGPGNAAAGDILLDRRTSFNTDPDKFYSLVLHEIGHSLGLEHEDDGPRSIMTTTLSENSLQPDDIRGIQEIYGPQDNRAPVYNFTSDRTNLTILQSPENIIINANDRGNRISGADSNEVFNGRGGNDTIFGGAGNDILNGQDNSDRLYGGAGHDKLYGGAGFDELYGGTGNDTLRAGNSSDRLYGGAGDDVLDGGVNVGMSVDGLWGESGNDTMFGGLGFDFMDGGTGQDVMFGGANADNLYGGEGNDTLYGQDGLDRLFGDDGDDVAYGGNGNDGLFGLRGDDRLYGGAGNDRFFAGVGNDIAGGGSGNDTIYGGAGFDTIDGGTGNDRLFGNFNADIFVFSDGHGDDIILDFQADNDFEKINLANISAITDMTDLEDNHMTQVGGNVVINTGGGNSITLHNVNIAQLDSEDFIF